MTEQSFELGAPELREVLTEGDLVIEGRLVDASNTTLYAVVTHGPVSLTCVYKPIAGERPLWDFPDGTLAGREVGAYLVSEATGWDVVPPTVMRDGPLGPGACQLWIDIDEDADLLALLHSDHPGLRRLAVFDAVVNNADRKGGHLLPTPGGHVYGVDHGVCFATEDTIARRRARHSRRVAGRPGRRSGRAAARTAHNSRGDSDPATRRPPAARGQVPRTWRRLARCPVATLLIRAG
jgi:hypothetical protein